jgi:LacI family transcriptional regulator
MRVTIKDIAKTCGVSVTAVSMALSDKPNRLSETTKQKIRENAQKMHYQPNMAAVSLVNRKSNMVGIVVNDLRNTHISSLYMSIIREIEKNGYSMICHVYEDSQTNVDRLLDQLDSENVSAIIWAKPFETDHIEENRLLSAAFEQMGIPVMTMDPYSFNCPGTDVLFDYEEGGLIATRYLLSNGHRKIGCLTGNMNYMVTEQRLSGYKKALMEYGVEFDEALVYHGDYTMESGYKALSYLMGQEVTAIFSFNDEMSFGIYRAARNYGIAIPEELSVVGFDDVPFADVMEIPLSTVKVPINEMGTYIGIELNRLMQEKNCVGEKRKIKMYKPAFLSRRSVGKINL